MRQVIGFRSGMGLKKRAREREKKLRCIFPCERIEDILIPPDLHKSSVIRYRLNKIIFTERRSKKKKEKKRDGRDNSELRV